MAFSFRSRTLRGLDLDFPAFELVGKMPVSMWKSILDRTKASRTAVSAAEGVSLVCEFILAESGYWDMLQVLREASELEAHARVAGDLHEKSVTQPKNSARAVAARSYLTGRSGRARFTVARIWQPTRRWAWVATRLMLRCAPRPRRSRIRESTWRGLGRWGRK